MTNTELPRKYQNKIVKKPWAKKVNNRKTYKSQKKKKNGAEKTL